jgi:hypothetical protein
MMFFRDSDRPPILAHQRFVDDRGSFASLNLQQRFQRIQDTNLTWLITATFPDWHLNGDCEDGDRRALNFERAPFHWGAPA